MVRSHNALSSSFSAVVLALPETTKAIGGISCQYESITGDALCWGFRAAPGSRGAKSLKAELMFESAPVFGYAAIFLIVFFDTFVLSTFFATGAAMMFVAGGGIYLGHLDLMTTWWLVCLASNIADVLSFALARPVLSYARVRRFVSRFNRPRVLFSARPAVAILILNFIPYCRVLVPLLAGQFMAPTTFLLINIPVSCLANACILACGYLITALFVG